MNNSSARLLALDALVRIDDGAYAHMAHTRGQCEVYLRLKNILPPPYPFE